MNLDHIQDALLGSYEQDGGINHLDGVNLPAQDSVNQLAVDIMHLLFPGYFEETGLTKEQVPQHVRRLLGRIHSRLVGDVIKCLRFAKESEPEQKADQRVAEVLRALPELRRIVQTDVVAAYHGDPAAHNVEEIILAYPCVLSISLQRFAHLLHKQGVPLLPRMLTEFGHERTGTDIHPGAQIGTHFFIDHGTGVVIGETARIGSHVKLYQGVTLGAKSFEVDLDGNPVKGIKRHPDIGDHVTIYAHATILGGETHIGQNSIIGSNVWIMNSVPANSVAYYKGENLIVRSRNAQDKFVETAETLHWVI